MRERRQRLRFRLAPDRSRRPGPGTAPAQHDQHVLRGRHEGMFHSDESNDRIRVSTLDGSSFAGGKTVQVEATVWAWTHSSEDSLEIYQAANANSPVWTLVATLHPTAAGARTLAATYVLPAGTLQAVRARFRYDSSGGPLRTRRVGLLRRPRRPGLRGGRGDHSGVDQRHGDGRRRRGRRSPTCRSTSTTPAAAGVAADTPTALGSTRPPAASPPGATTRDQQLAGLHRRGVRRRRLCRLRLTRAARPSA